MGLLFYPRGGSAQVVRYLSPALAREGWDVSLLCGSLGQPGDRTHAETFYAGIDLTAVDYSPAFEAFERGRDPIAEPVPYHPSFENQPGVPDRVFAAVSPELGDHVTDFWQKTMASAWADQPSVLHFHHLTPLQEAAHRLWPDLPLIADIHGTETKMLDRIGRRVELARELGADLEGMADRAERGELEAPAGLDADQLELFEHAEWASWRYGRHWEERLRSIAQSADRIIVNSPHERAEVERLLGIAGDRVVEIPNGIDTRRFDRNDLGVDERLRFWHRWLVEDPRGWDASKVPGSVRYTDEDLGAFRDSQTGEASPVILFVGRFLAVKRVPLLLRAYARARPRFAKRAPLVIWGGFPDEWEGEHPVSVARAEGEEDVFFTGWRGHEELPEGLACADVFAGPSIKEGFGQVFIEAMACGLPVIAARSGGPISFVNVESGRPNGWLIEPDDLDGLTDALVEAVNDEGARRERGVNAHEQIRAAYSWDHLAKRFVEVYERAMEDAARRSRG
jgi:glycosyltransferase involved in cell wall biosynthesis